MTAGTLQPAAKTKRTSSSDRDLPRFSPGSVTNLICQVKKGDATAAPELFARYCRRLLGLAQLHDREDLWHLLAKITVRKAQRLVEEQERQKRNPRAARQGTASQGSESALPVDLSVEQIGTQGPAQGLPALHLDQVHLRPWHGLTLV
jgi:hypothetical protein